MFFFVKQKTAYEMRISDWSSDVCSSDLLEAARHARAPGRQPCRLFDRRRYPCGRGGFAGAESMINPKAIALEHKFTTVDVAWHDYGGWVVTVHGRATGEFGCNVGSGADPESALADAPNKVRNYPEDRSAISDGHLEVQAKSMPDIK